MFKKFLLGLCILGLLEPCLAQDSFVARCDGCNPTGYRNAALAVASGIHESAYVHVFDNANRHVEKVRLIVESEPSTNIIIARSVPVEFEVKDFATRYWSMEAEFKQVAVPPAVAPSLPRFLTDGFTAGQTRGHIQSQIQNILTTSFGSWTVASPASVIQQAMARLGAVPALGTGNFVITLTFADGGQIDVELNVVLRVSPATIGIYEFKVIDDTGTLDGNFFPNRRASLENFQAGGPVDENYVMSILMLAQQWGIPSSCVRGTEIIKIVCTPNHCHATIVSRPCPLQ